MLFGIEENEWNVGYSMGENKTRNEGDKKQGEV